MEEAPATVAVAGRPARPRWRSWLLPAGLLLLLVLLTVNVLAGGPLASMDRWIQRTARAQATSANWWWVGHGRRSPARLLLYLTGPEPAVAFLGLTAVLLSAWRRTAGPLASAVLAGALLAATVLPAKLLIGRPAPGHAVVLPGTLGDFPSGHTATASVCFVLAALLLTPGPRSWPRRIALAAAWLVAVLVGVALIWNNGHWFTDVVAGWVLGGLIVHLTMRFTGRRPGPPGRPRPAGAGAEGRELPVAR